MLCCPLTTQIKGYPFEVLIAGDRPGTALADQVKNLDWVARTKEGRYLLHEGATQRAGFHRSKE